MVLKEIADLMSAVLWIVFEKLCRTDQKIVRNANVLILPFRKRGNSRNNHTVRLTLVLSRCLHSLLENGLREFNVI